MAQGTDNLSSYTCRRMSIPCLCKVQADRRSRNDSLINIPTNVGFVVSTGHSLCQTTLAWIKPQLTLIIIL